MTSLECNRALVREFLAALVAADRELAAEVLAEPKIVLESWLKTRNGLTVFHLDRASCGCLVGTAALKLYAKRGGDGNCVATEYLASRLEIPEDLAHDAGIAAMNVGALHEDNILDLEGALEWIRETLGQMLKVAAIRTGEG